MQNSIENTIFDNIIDSIINIDVDELYKILIKLMGSVQITGLPGTTKKEITINVLKRIINHVAMSDGQRSTLNYIVDTQIPFIINVVKLIGKENINLKKLRKSFICSCLP